MQKQGWCFCCCVSQERESVGGGDDQLLYITITFVACYNNMVLSFCFCWLGGKGATAMKMLCRENDKRKEISRKGGKKGGAEEGGEGQVLYTQRKHARDVERKRGQSPRHTDWALGCSATHTKIKKKKKRRRERAWWLLLTFFFFSYTDAGSCGWVGEYAIKA